MASSASRATDTALIAILLGLLVQNDKGQTRGTRGSDLVKRISRMRIVEGDKQEGLPALPTHLQI